MIRKNNIRIFRVEYYYEVFINYMGDQSFNGRRKEKEDIVADTAQQAIERCAIFKIVESHAKWEREGIITKNQEVETWKNVDIVKIEFLTSIYLSKEDINNISF